ncbi:MAG: hypothetical protein H3C49_07830 [Alphaproteobacteria bacterium]|nr:hypothetical protein [Alphaproteobacteria bacterium]HRI75665.1 nicotianamine synthase family protein [Alphaproteobacteria bacterium]
MPTNMLKQEAINAIRASYQLLRTEKNLSPMNHRVTDSLTHLVRTLTRCQSPELAKFLLDAPELAVERENLPVLCGIAECEMEKFWAKHLIGRPVCDLAEFWYFPEYTELCQAELDLFKTRKFDRISFLGAGALPLTAFLLARHCPQSKVICVDFDEEACALAEQLSRKIGLKEQVSVERMDALQYMPGENELVICASLLQGREQVYKNLQSHNCALLVRDAEGPYQYLYKAAELPAVTSFREIAKTQVDARRINTSRYFERAAEWMENARAA